jgi:hypothetical protein
MSRIEKLQKAVELTLSAGYQLNREAFEFLNMAAATEDPVEIMSKALERIESLKNKPLFIEKSLLEELTKKPEPIEEAPPRQEIEQAKILPEPQPRMMEGKKLFRPYAKEVEANINVMEDFGSKLSPNGTIDGYLEYFRDRFKRLERLLRQLSVYTSSLLTLQLWLLWGMADVGQTTFSLHIIAFNSAT